MELAGLNVTVLRRVVRLLDQAARVRCMLASKALAAAITHADAWPAVAVHKPTGDALDFIAAARCAAVSLTGGARAVARLLDGMYERGVHLDLRALTLRFDGLFRANALAAAVADLPALEELVVSCGRMTGAACLALGDGGGLRRLHTLRVAEQPNAHGERRLEVYLQGAELPALREVVLRVCTSDVLAHAWRFPALRHVVYDNDGDTFEDARLDGCSLDCLETDVANDEALGRLAAALAAAAGVQRLSLALLDDADLDTHMPVQSLVLRMCQDVALTLDFAVAAGLRALHVQSLQGSTGWSLRLLGAGSFERFLLWTRRCDARIDPGGELSMPT